MNWLCIVGEMARMLKNLAFIIIIIIIVLEIQASESAENKAGITARERRARGYKEIVSFDICVISTFLCLWRFFTLKLYKECWLCLKISSLLPQPTGVFKPCGFNRYINTPCLSVVNCVHSKPQPEQRKRGYLQILTSENTSQSLVWLKMLSSC